MRNYNKKPKLIGNLPCAVEEMMHYTYLPIKLCGTILPVYEERLAVFDKIIGAALCDFVGAFGLDEYADHYVYLTVKNLYQKNGNFFNRGGWHSDGFGTPDISYIWSNKQPTIFNDGDFWLTDDDKKSMVEMEEQARAENNFAFHNDSLVRMDQFSIHKVGKPQEGVRCFVKICFSKDKYNLIGNSKNYLLDCNWEYFERNNERNIPQKNLDKASQGC